MSEPVNVTCFAMEQEGDTRLRMSWLRQTTKTCIAPFLDLLRLVGESSKVCDSWEIRDRVSCQPNTARVMMTHSTSRENSLRVSGWSDSISSVPAIESTTLTSVLYVPISDKKGIGRVSEA